MEREGMFRGAMLASGILDFVAAACGAVCSGLAIRSLYLYIQRIISSSGEDGSGLGGVIYGLVFSCFVALICILAVLFCAYTVCGVFSVRAGRRKTLDMRARRMAKWFGFAAAIFFSVEAAAFALLGGAFVWDWALILFLVLWALPLLVSAYLKMMAFCYLRGWLFGAAEASAGR